MHIINKKLIQKLINWHKGIHSKKRQENLIKFITIIFFFFDSVVYSNIDSDKLFAGVQEKINGKIVHKYLALDLYSIIYI